MSIAREDADLESHLYRSLETLCICFPARLSGSEVLEKAISYLFEYCQHDVPSDCCVAERVDKVPLWVRRRTINQLELLGRQQEILRVNIEPSETSWPSPFPLQRFYRVLANGLSVGTSEDGVTAELAVVRSWEELRERGEQNQLQGKMVLFNYENFTTYGEVAAFRSLSGRRAEPYGIVAALIRSLTPNCSVSGVHTGTQEMNISMPCACVSIEDAEVLTRLIARGHRLHAQLFLPCHFVTGPKFSRNIVLEIKGFEFPNEYVIIGGHTDCWDCQMDGCQGAHDDGQGVIASLEIIKYLHKHNYRPRRTIRAVLFVDEEIGQSGANAYQRDHQHEANNVQVAIETDLGVGPVCGFGFTGTSEAREMLQGLLFPLANTLQMSLEIRESWSGEGVDISPMIRKDGVPGMLLRHEDTWWNEDYFHFHHTNSDTIDHVDKKLLVNNFQVLLGTAWVLANCDCRLPRTTSI
jgi:carboxypeptidase Q